jgi:hypothetical protein
MLPMKLSEKKLKLETLEIALTDLDRIIEILKIMKDPNIDTFRQKLKGSKTVIKWIDIAAKWLEEDL